MRYLVGEASWPAVELATRIAESGTLLTRTDSPEDFPLYHEMSGHDLAIIDEGMLDQGLRLLRLRGVSPQVPLCVLTHVASPDRRVSLLSNGADLVLQAGCEPEDALIRLCALARRAHGLSTPQINLGPLSLDLLKRQAHLAGTRLALAPKLYETLEYLALRPGQTVPREALLSHVYQPGDEPRARVFDVYMNALRGHLAGYEDEITIMTYRGLGFRLSLAQGSDARPAVA